MVQGIENDYSNIYINIRDKDNEIERFGNAIDNFDTKMIDCNQETILNSTIIVSQLKCPIEVTERLIDFCYSNHKFLILTPCRPNKLIKRTDLIDKVNIITCNKTECETIFETDDIDSCVKKYPNKLIVTLGGDGLKYYNGKRIIHMPAMNVVVEDTTGAGDTLNGNLACSLSQGMDLNHALRRAMYASSLKVQKKTAQIGMPYREELDHFITRYRNKNFEYEDELNFAIDLVKKAFNQIKSRNSLNIQVKPDNTLVTTSDIDIETYLLKKLKKSINKTIS